MTAHDSPDLVGRHCRLIADPTRFGEVISEALTFTPATGAA
ncbi:hypothetical protein [Nocardia tengchongensis]